MKRSKRIIALLVSVLLIVALLITGCNSINSDNSTVGKTDTESEPSASNPNVPITITCMFSDHPSQPYQEETWILPKVIEEKFNITMKMQAIPSSAFGE